MQWFKSNGISGEYLGGEVLPGLCWLQSCRCHSGAAPLAPQNPTVQIRNVGGFPPSSSPENRKSLSAWGCFCSRTIDSICGPPQLALTAACSYNQKCASWVFQTGSQGVDEFIQDLHWFRMSPPNVVSQRPSCLSQCWLLYPL